ncbi:Maltose phosphorylase [Lactococcus lactis]|nr:Maltose phosphorylase [Lactococcus lactis]
MIISGSWLAIVHGFAQMKTWDGQLSFAPFLPQAWTGYAFHINYRGRLLKISVGQEVKLELLRGQSLSLKIYDETVELSDSYVTKTK